MTVNDPGPGTNPPAAGPLTSLQHRYIERARALADAGDAGRPALGELLGETTGDIAVLYASAFGAARVHLANLLDIISELAGEADTGDDEEDLEAYCRACGEWAGMFLGMDGWHHFRGDPAPGGVRTLYDADHEAEPGWCAPPGRLLSPAGAATVRQALADAAAWRTRRTEGDREADARQAAAYEALLRRLAVTGEAGQ